MKKILSIFAIVVAVPLMSHASDLSDAIANVRTACGPISDVLNEMKTRAGIRTAVSGVGTVAGGVALGTGIAKANVDKEVEEWEHILDEMEREQIESGVQFSEIDADEVKQALRTNIGTKNISDAQQNIDELNKKSKILGNVRTGTMATATVANIVGSFKPTFLDWSDVPSQINICITATKTLSNIKMQSSLDGSADESELQRANMITSACSEWGLVDLSKIDKRATGSQISSIIGAVTGTVGTAASVSANLNNVREDDSDSGKKTEKTLNTTANVAAGAVTLASGVATGFNVAMISEIKKIIEIADKCEGALK